MAEKAKEEKAKTKSEFQNVANSRQTPNQKTATDQPLTHYHSFFYNILSWENPRVTAITYASLVIFILSCRYLPAVRYGFKILYTVLGVTAVAEAIGKMVFSYGVASSFRPKRYYTIPRETLEACLEDVEQLINFFVIEFQRILFAENVVHTLTACVAAFFAHFLLKIVPFWGLSLIGTSVVFLTPLIYMNNKELIDQHLSNAQDIANAQASQVKDLANQHTSQVTGTMKKYAGEYTSKAQEYIGSARSRYPAVPSATTTSKPPPMMQDAPTTAAGPGAAPKYQASDFPHAPKQEPLPGVTSHQEQYENSQFGGQAVPVA